MRSFLLCLLSALCLSACSMQAMSEKLLPDDVRAEIDAQTEALLRGDTDFMIEAFPEEQDNPAFREQIMRMANNVPDAAILSKHIVGVQAKTGQRYSETDGAVQEGVFNLGQEIAFDNGEFVLVQTAHSLDDRGQCCVLRAINASRHEDSPFHAGQVIRSRVLRGLGLFLILSTFATVVFLIVKVGGRKARDAQMPDA